MVTGSDRGQAHTLEGVAAALLVVMSMLLALQMTAVTPLTASTSNQYIQAQERAAVKGVLATSDGGELRSAVRYWNATNETTAGFYGADPEPYYTSEGPVDELGFLKRLNETFAGTGIAYNVRFVYVDPDGQRVRQQFVYNGRPTSNAVTATRVVTLYDHDRLVGPDGPSGRTVSDPVYFANNDTARESPVHTTVSVEVVAWRM